MLDKLQSRYTLVSSKSEFEHRLKGTVEQYKATVQMKDDQIFPSQVRSLTDVLDVLEERIVPL